MEKLFELSAQLTLDAASFLRALAQAEQAARSAAAALSRMQSAAASSWGQVTQGIQQATASMQAYLALHSTPAPPPASPAASPAPGASAASLVSALSALTISLDGQTVGRLIAPTVSREIAKGVR